MRFCDLLPVRAGTIEAEPGRRRFSRPQTTVEEERSWFPDQTGFPGRFARGDLERVIALPERRGRRWGCIARTWRHVTAVVARLRNGHRNDVISVPVVADDERTSRHGTANGTSRDRRTASFLLPRGASDGSSDSLQSSRDRGKPFRAKTTYGFLTAVSTRLAVSTEEGGTGGYYLRV